MTNGSGLPQGTVTFLLTDIEASSRMWQDEPDAMGVRVERHTTVIHEAVVRNRGTLVKAKGEGDSTFSVFSRPTDAVVATLEAQRELATSDGPIRVRMAIHTGEAELRDGDYYGNAINRCARLRDIAHGGQTICSQATAELVVESVPLDITLLDLGSHRLRDLDRPQRVFQVCHPALAADFPALRSLDSRPNNLPPQLTTFIGREQEVAVIKKLLKADRLITLTGSGGCGKTRLALQVAADVLDDYPDGVWYVELAPLTDSSLVPNAIAQAVGVREARDEAIAATLQRILGERATLIVLDNCEHLIDACASLSNELLRSCPRLIVMTTSREPLGVQGETTWRVPSLALPQRIDEHAMTAYEAVRLFVDRAVRARPTFEVTNENAPAVAQICQRLDGLPLAIELAAARVRVMTPEQIVSGLTDAFRVLGAGARASLPRQRTLEASIDWSYNLLNDEQCVLLRRLSVFAGTFSLDSAEAVCSGAGLEAHRVFDVLMELVDRSLLQPEEDTGRYRMLETIRQYGRQKLAGAREADAVSLRHLEHFIDLMERARPLIEAGGTVDWMARLRRERANLRAALEWAAEADHAADGLRLATAWPEYWAYCGHLEEGRLRITELRDAADPQGSLLARTVIALTGIALRQGHYDGAYASRTEGLALAREAGDPFLEVRAMTTGGWMLTFVDPKNATAFWADAIAKAEACGDSHSVRFGTLELAVVHWWRGEVTRVRELLDENVIACRDAGDLLTLALCEWILGACAFMTGRLEGAVRHFREAVALGESTGDLWLFPQYVSTLADVLVYRNETSEARRLIEEVIEKTTDTGNVQAIGMGQCVLAILEFAEGNAEATLAAAAPGAQIMRRVYPWYSTRAFAAGAWAAAKLGDHEHAVRLLADAERDAHGFPPWVAVVEWTKSLVALLGEDYRAAETHSRAALAQGLASSATLAPEEGQERTSSTVCVADALETLACSLAAQGEHEEAARFLGASEAVRGRGGPRRFASQVEWYEADVRTLRDQLGERAFDDAWASGAALSTKDALVLSTRGRGDRKRPSSGWDSLTPTELEVVRRVAQGLSNPQIAEKMFISRRTVTTHLTHIFAKLGISSRTELTAEATRRGAHA